MFRAISRLGFQYDSSLPSRYQSPALWPYTAHQGARQACSIPPCPSLSHPEVWELPMTMMTDGLGGQCAMLDACRYEETEDSIQRMLTRNFVRNGSGTLQLLLEFFILTKNLSYFPTQERRRLNCFHPGITPTAPSPPSPWPTTPPGSEPGNTERKLSSSSWTLSSSSQMSSSSQVNNCSDGFQIQFP